MGKASKPTVSEVEQLAGMITEGTKSTIKDLLSESIASYLREEVLNEDDDEEKDDEEVENPFDGATDSDEDETPESETDDEEAQEDEDEDLPAEGDDADGEESEDVEDEWSEFDAYKIGGEEGAEEYDFTGETDPGKIAKVFKLMKNDDQVSVVSDGDTVHITDNEAGTEYVIELDAEESDDLDDNDFMTESLGYTDNYQDKDPIEGLSMDEPAKNARDWHRGIPKDTKKPWAGNGKIYPFNKKPEKVFEIVLNDEVETEEEEPVSTILPEDHAFGQVTSRSTTIKNGRPGQKARNKRTAASGQVTGTADNPTTESVNEALRKKVDMALAENKQLKETVAKVSKIMKEAVQVNVNLGHIVRLMVENTTTKEEKENIVKQFSTVKSSDEAKKLYESISSNLKNVRNTTVIAEQATTAVGSKNINESKIYESQETDRVLDLMRRVKNL
jgi:hypothetical protein